ncbi:MAG: dihydroneopterin aldolase [Syntrophothermus sp.]
MGDRITLKNMVFYGYHGAFEAEKELGQRFEVDVELYMDRPELETSDDIEMTVNYVEVFNLVKEIVEEREFNLIEAMAQTIAARVLSSYDLQKVVVRVRKPHAPVGGIFDYVEAETVRGKSVD